MMKIEKAKLPKGMSYPLKSSRLQTALTASAISIDVSLIYGSRNSFEAFFWPRSPRIDRERLYVRVGMVNTADGGRARRYMEKAALPELVKWLSEILGSDPRSPVRKQEQLFIRSLIPPPDWE